jgi:dienelactone hydrolase
VSAASNAIQLEVDEPSPLVDDPARFAVVGLVPGEPVAVRTRWQVGGVAVATEARFVAGPDGRVAPGADASRGGTYRGRDAYGLWWSGAAAPPTGVAPLDTTVSVVCRGQQVAEALLARRWVGIGVEVVPVAGDGLVGRYFRPQGPGRFPGVVVVGGSMGGTRGSDAKAALLASRGVAAVAAAYFGVPGTPAGLAGVGVEYLHAWVGWLLARDEVSGARVGVLGASRGSELALLAATRLAEVASVVVASPSAVLWPGIGVAPGEDTAAWTWQGQALPFVRTDPEVLTAQLAEEPVRLRPVFERALAGAAGVAEIPVEDVHGPVLLLSGDDDALWPAGPMADALWRRAKSHGAKHEVRHIRYRHAGHLCSSPAGIPVPSTITHPLDGRRYDLGGTARGNGQAASDAWGRTVDFLRRALGGQSTP